MDHLNVSRPIAILLSLVPGWGHIYLGFEARGLVIFTLAALGGFGWINATWIYLGEGQSIFQGITLVLFGGLFLFSLVDIFIRTAKKRVSRSSKLCESLLWEGMMHYVMGNDLAAEEKFRETTRVDGLNVEAYFRAGIVAARRGELQQAKRFLKKARRLDHDLKWSWEIRRELEVNKLEVAPTDLPTPAEEAAHSDASSASEDEATTNEKEITS